MAVIAATIDSPARAAPFKNAVSEVVYPLRPTSIRFSSIVD
jgi:hypothetical protein